MFDPSTVLARAGSGSHAFHGSSGSSSSHGYSGGGYHPVGSHTYHHYSHGSTGLDGSTLVVLLVVAIAVALVVWQVRRRLAG